MPETFKQITSRLYGWLRSTSFFAFTLILFIVHTLWLALSSNLLPYDEYYHIALIKLYATQWSPFITSQPVEGVFYGDATRLHSYVYHFLMSYPYRLFSSFIESEEVVIILLRVLNIAMVIGGVYLFRRLFLRAGISKRLVQVVIAFFLLTPFVVVLASQNNYDNFMFLLVPLFFGFAYNIVKKSNLSSIDVLMFLSTGLFISLVKHAFTLFFLVTGLYVLLSLLKKRKTILSDLKASLKKTTKPLLIGVVLLFLCTAGLFIERHGLNLYRYGDINVNCVKVQSESVCNNYSPWRRNNNIRNNPPQDSLYGNPLSFTQHWGATMMRGLYANFANVIPNNLHQPDPYGHYVFRPLLWLPISFAWTLLVLSAAAIIKSIKFLKENQLLNMFLVVSLVLLVAVYLFNYRTYSNLGRAYAIQVRYVLPLLLPIMLVCASAICHLLRPLRFTKELTLIVLCLYVLNGGVAGWIIRSDSSWYWQKTTVITINQSAQNVLKWVVPH